MKFVTTGLVALALGLGAGCTQAQQMEKGTWRAANQTAKAITGDVAFAGERFGINFLSFPVAQIRTVPAEELKAVFNLDEAPPAAGNLYRLLVPGSTKFMHKNTLCGAEDTQWMVTYVERKTLRIAFFSGEKIPTLTPEAMATGTDLCGTFGFVR